MAQESWKMDQDETDCHRPEVSVLCINNCGLLGNPATMNLCSKCYQDVRLPKPDDTFSSSSSSSSSLGGTQTSTNSVGVAVPDFSAERSAKSLLMKPMEEREKDKEKEEERGEEKKASVKEAATVIAVLGGRKREGKRSRESGMMEQTPAPNRCFSCRKRVGLAGFQCRCGDMFCSSHRYSDKHACSFDYKSAARDAIAKANPIVKAEKVRKI